MATGKDGRRGPCLRRVRRENQGSKGRKWLVNGCVGFGKWRDIQFKAVKSRHEAGSVGYKPG